MFKIKTETKEKDLGWKKIKKEIKQYKKSYTAIGFFGGSGDNPRNNIAARAYIQEKGAKIKVTKKMQGWWLANFGKKLSKKVITIPPRPFMRMTYEKNISTVHKIVKNEYNKVLSGKSTAKQSLALLGVWYKGELQKMITSGAFAPNSSFTIKQKDSSHPLIDEGEMRNSVTNREVIRG